MTVVDCLKRTRADAATTPPIADFEVIPPFDGSPDGIFVWFIVHNSDEVPAFQESALTEATDRLLQELRQTEFPRTALDALSFGVTSLEDIKNGGGRFAYFR